MNSSMNRAMALAACLVIANCAGRAPKPVDVSQADDHLADCAQLSDERVANEAKIDELGGEHLPKVAQNTAAIAVGLVLWPVLFLTDFQGAAHQEIAALEKRNEQLAILAQQKGCA